MPDRFDDPRPMTPESAPSALATEEPSMARTLGMIGVCLLLLGVISLWKNTSGEFFIGPTIAAVCAFVGIMTMLYHAARDADPMVRRSYLGFGFAVLIAGAVLSLIPKPAMGDWMLPWGGLGLMTGLFFVLAAGRHENEAPWDRLIPVVLTFGGVAMAIAGLIGVTLSTEFLPRFTAVSVLGLLYWWAAIIRIGTSTETGFRLGRIMGWVGLAALLFGIGRSALPSLAHWLGAMSSEPEPFFMPRGIVLIGLGGLMWMIAFALNSDRPIAAMTRRELSAYFYTPIAYLVLFGTAFIGWIGYFVFIGLVLDATQMGMMPMREPILRYYAAGFFSAVGVMFVVPVITMRLLSEERRTGTIEVLLTGPVTEWQVVLSKFVAALLFFLVLTIPWGLFLIPVYMIGRTGFDYLPILSFYLAVICTGAAFVAMGLFFSSITRNQIIAAVLTFAGMFLAVAPVFVEDSEALSAAVKTIASQISFYNVWSNALGGKLPVHQLISFLSVAVFWLFLTTKVVEARKWS